MQREKVCAVIGLARAGVPAARFLAERGARVLGFDHRSLDELSEEARALSDLGVELRTGAHGFAGLEKCATIVLSPGLKVHHEPLCSIIAHCEMRGAEVIGELELAARHCPAPMIAVTGTKGKSTTVKLITEILQACGVDARRAGNTGTPLIAELPNLSPQSWAVVEVSSFQLEKAPTFKPRVAVLLNLLADHQDYHPSLEQYWTTKLKMFEHQGAGDTAIFNLDDDNAAQVFAARRWPAEHVFGVSGRDAARPNPEAGPLQVAWSAGALTIAGTAVIRWDEVPLHGEHNRANLAAALQAALATAPGQSRADSPKVGLPAGPKIHLALRDFEALPHRLEVVGEVNGVRCVNDSQSTIPEAAIKAIQAFPRPVTLIAGGRAKLHNSDAFDALGQAIAREAHLLVTIGEAAERIADAARRASFPQEKIIIGKTLTNAVKQAIIGTPPGGTVVLSPSCASFDQFNSYEERGEAFRAAVAAFSQS